MFIYNIYILYIPIYIKYIKFNFFLVQKVRIIAY